MSQKKGGAATGANKAPQMPSTVLDDAEDQEPVEDTEDSGEGSDDASDANGTDDAKAGGKQKIRMKREAIMIAAVDGDGKPIVDDKGTVATVQKTMVLTVKLFKLVWDFSPLGVDRVVVLDESELDPSILEHAAHHGMGQWGTDAMALKKGATIRQKADALFKNVQRIVVEKTWKGKRDPEAQRKAVEKAAADGKQAGLTAAAEALVANKVAKDLKAAWLMLGVKID